MKNIKKMFFIMALIMLILGVSTVVSATNDTTIVNTVSESPTDITAVEPQLASASSNKVIKNTTTKEINKKTTDENIKTATKTVEVNNMDELTTTINNAVQDSENDEYIINLNPGTYQITSNPVLNNGTYRPNITINANNQILSGKTATRYTRFNNGCNITINDAIITQRIQNYANNIIIYNSNITNTFTNIANMNLTFRNTNISGSITNNGNILTVGTHINNTITNNGRLIIADDVTFGSNFILEGNGEIITNLTNTIVPYLKVYDGNYVLEKLNITTNKINNGNLTVKNSLINSTITNNGRLIIADDVTFGSNCYIPGNGEIITNNTYVKYYLATYNGSYVLENATIIGTKTNYGNLVRQAIVFSS